MWGCESLEARRVLAAAPVLGPIADLSLESGETSAIIALDVSDADTEISSLLVGATADTQLAALDQEFDLGTYQDGNDYFLDARGADEKYLYNEASDTWYFLLPNGELYEFTGNRDSSDQASLDGILLADLDASVYANPSLLHNAVSVDDPITFEFTIGDDLTLEVTPNASVSGTFLATVSVFDGTNLVTQSFVIDVDLPNTIAPNLDPISDITLESGETSAAIDLDVTDADTPITDIIFSGEVESELYVLDQDLELGTYQDQDFYFTNARGSNEKYLYNAESDTWYYILPNGNLFEFNGDRDSSAPASLSGVLLTNVGTDVYADPSLLHDAESVADDFTLTFTGGANPTVEVTADPGVTGTFIATITASDGTQLDVETFEILVSAPATAAPNLAALPDLNIESGETLTGLDLDVVDPDTAIAAITFEGEVESLLFVLDDELDLGTYQNADFYFENARGSNEKYLYNAESDTWYYLLPNGNLYEFNGDRDSSEPASLSGVLLANVGTDVYADPTLLHQAVSVQDALEFDFNVGANPTMDITADAGVTGTFVVTVTASDGSEIDRESFLVDILPWSLV